jgi:hypothetical protein
MGEFIIVAIVIIGILTWQFFTRFKKTKLNHKLDWSSMEQNEVKYHNDGTYTVIEHVNGLERHLKFAPNEKVKINFKEPKDILCPYCKYRFPKMPARSRKCPECKEYIHRVKDYVNEIYKLLTVKEYEKNAKIESDKRWIEHNKQIEEYSKVGNYKGLSHTYFLMALQLYEEGKDFISLLQQHFRFDLLEYQKLGCKQVRIISFDGKRGKTYSIEEVLENKYLPCKTLKNVDWHDIGYFEPIIK